MRTRSIQELPACRTSLPAVTNSATRGEPHAPYPIVCTIGPATSSQERLEQLMRTSMHVARLNFSHDMYVKHEQVIRRVPVIWWSTSYLA